MKATLSVLLLMAATQTAYPHQAPTGWSYDTGCCNTMDCREVSASMIDETKSGYRIKYTGEVIPYNDKRVRESKDGEYHWCSVQGKDNTKTICLYRPQPSY